MTQCCDWCCNAGHFVDQCPHLAKQLLNPDPSCNEVRALFRVIDSALEQVGHQGIAASAVIENTPSDVSL